LFSWSNPISNCSAAQLLCCSIPRNPNVFTDKAVISRSNHRSNAVHTYQREQFKILSDISKHWALQRLRSWKSKIQVLL
jgi:hypothetical protein